VMMCAHHSALFRFEDGHCIEGPCEGARLTAVGIRVVDGEVRCTAVPAGQTSPTATGNR
jgi:nitrite reductase/ring-hydroxylating ferredoxin subunit